MTHQPANRPPHGCDLCLQHSTCPPGGWTARTDLTDLRPITGRALPRPVWWIIETKD